MMPVFLITLPASHSHFGAALLPGTCVVTYPVAWSILALLLLITATVIYLQLPLVPHSLMLLSGYLALCIAQYKFGTITEFTDKNDLSYSVYILGWPVQQMVLLFGYGTQPFPNAVLSLLIVMPLAMLSWRYVEQPALSLKERFG